MTVSAQEVVAVDLAPLAGQPSYLVRELLLTAWTARGWPLKAMGHAQWEQLARRATAGPPAEGWKQVFPGAVLAEVIDGALTLRRLPQGD